MQTATFNAQCPFEIGDMVRLAHDPRRAVTITDIACIHYLKTRTVKFVYEFDNSGEYHGIDMPTTVEVKVQHNRPRRP